ncbi:MAG: hypothetical protein J6U11_04055, partial [Campylobacter sp.]|nr:hypothetical protein [Campylobacter sp.]
MKLRFLRFGIVTSAMILIANADTFTVTSSDTFTHTKSDGTTIDQKITNKTFKPSYGAQNARYAGSIGFFDAVGASNAVSILNGTHNQTPSWYNEAGINLNNPTTADTTNLDNMERSFEIIKETNRLRALDGLTAYEITHDAMAIAQLRTSWSRSRVAHVSTNVGNGYYTGKDDLYNTERLYPANNIAENLSWNYGITQS